MFVSADAPTGCGARHRQRFFAEVVDPMIAEAQVIGMRPRRRDRPHRRSPGGRRQQRPHRRRRERQGAGMTLTADVDVELPGLGLRYDDTDAGAPTRSPHRPARAGGHHPRPARAERLGQDQPHVAAGVAAAPHRRRGARRRRRPLGGRRPHGRRRPRRTGRRRRRVEGPRRPRVLRRAAPGVGRGVRPPPPRPVRGPEREDRQPVAGQAGGARLHHGPGRTGARDDVRRGTPRHGRPEPLRVLRRGAQRLPGAPPHGRSSRPTTSTRWRRCSGGSPSSTTGGSWSTPTPTPCAPRAPRSSARPAPSSASWPPPESSSCTSAGWAGPWRRSPTAS